MAITGKVWKYGDDVNTDVIFPGRYTYALMSDEEMGTHALEDLDSNFNKNGQPGDIIVAGKNWGCGSSREQAAKCLKARGVGAVVAGSYARIFYRNSINEGLPIITCPSAAKMIQSGENITVDFDKGIITCAAGTIPFKPYPSFVSGIVNNGGLIPYTQRWLTEHGKL
ncbi:MAG: 3-isopropylmalate dehydratase small subunit [Peptococcaceae bacterium]|nr:3-isopropylmalate dehydratase small subunit [Peptococcaceae bacterium]